MAKTKVEHTDVGGEDQAEIMEWLMSVPATDVDFKLRLEKASAETVREVLEQIDGVTGMATKRKALENRLKDILAGLVASNDRQSRTLTLEVETLQAERDIEERRSAEQIEREARIAECHQVIGRIQGANVVAKFGTVSEILWVRDALASKIYKDIPGLETQEKFCRSIGYSAKHLTDQMKNLEAFGLQFLETVSQLRVGYRELKQLRQLTAAGEVTIDAEAMIIGDERIPLNAEHSEELQAAIEKIIEEKDSIRQRVDKLEKDVAGVVKEETKGLKAELGAALREVKRLKPFDPEEKDRSWSVEQMAEICGHCDAFSTAIYKFVLDPRLKGDHQLIAEINGYILASEAELRDLRDRFETEYDIYGG